jgi:dephospho-CoA kinase
MLKVGITGGMGSGKSTVAHMFSLLGIAVYYADSEAKKLMENDPVLREAITGLFGSQAYQDHKLNRALIAARVFNHPEKLQALNAVVHPAVIAHGATWMQEQQSPYTLKEAALLFESGSHKNLDFVIGVYCPQDIRVQRILRRDGMQREDVLARMKNQMNEEEKMKKCDAVINNDDRHAIIPQVLQLHQALLGKT